jgi:peptidoglycan/LPS O-acetylase OafA/YrhL
LTKTIGPLTSFRFFFAGLIVYQRCLFLPEYQRFRPNFDTSLGVVCFFVLSGFILSHTYPSLPTAASKLSYLAQRIGRIWPLHLVMLAACVVLAGDWWRASISPFDLAFNAFLLQSWTPSLDVNFGFNGVSWSISTELFFYVAFSAFVGASLGRGLIIIALCLATTWAIARMQGCGFSNSDLPETISPGFTCFSLAYTFPRDARIVEFFLGIAAYRLCGVIDKHWSPPPAIGTAAEGAALLGFGAWVYLGHRPTFELTHALLGDSIFVHYAIRAFAAPAACLLFVVFALQRGFLSRSMFNARWLIFCGEISFAPYMVHQPVIRVLTLHPWLTEVASFPVVAAFIFAVSTALSAAMFLLVENPCRVCVKVTTRRLSQRILRGAYGRPAKPA